jgi:hypothetical protein
LCHSYKYTISYRISVLDELFMVTIFWDHLVNLKSIVFYLELQS